MSAMSCLEASHAARQLMAEAATASSALLVMTVIARSSPAYRGDSRIQYRSPVGGPVVNP